jgi:hypothetical protein
MPEHDNPERRPLDLDRLEREPQVKKAIEATRGEEGR